MSTSKLFSNVGTDRPPVISTDKDDRGLHDRCKVQASMEISLKGMLDSAAFIQE